MWLPELDSSPPRSGKADGDKSCSYTLWRCAEAAHSMLSNTSPLHLRPIAAVRGSIMRESTKSPNTVTHPHPALVPLPGEIWTLQPESCWILLICSPPLPMTGWRKRRRAEIDGGRLALRAPLPRWMDERVNTKQLLQNKRKKQQKRKTNKNHTTQQGPSVLLRPLMLLHSPFWCPSPDL